MPKFKIQMLVVLLTSSLLVACGGGSGGPDAPASILPAASVAAPELSKYEGVWRQDCKDHMLLTLTLPATSGNIFTSTPKEEHFANADCTGAVVATGSFGQPKEAVQYAAPLANASVKLLTGEPIKATVDPATSTLAVTTFKFTGNGVKAEFYVDGKTLTHIQYADDSAPIVIVRDAVNGGTTYGALLLRNAELLALIPIGTSSTSFQVNRRYIR